MAQPGEKNVSAYVDPKVATAFTELADGKGYVKRKAIEGALKVFLSLPSEVQVAVMESRNSSVYKILIQKLRDIELTKNLEALTPEQTQVLIESAKELTKRLFPKKKVK